MAASRQGVGHCLFGRFRFPARSELADPFHQVVPQADAKPMRLPCGQFSTCLVLIEPLFGLPGGDGDWLRAQFAGEPRETVN